VLEIWPGLHEDGLYGLAIDLGSTTVAAHLTGDRVEEETLEAPEYTLPES